MLRTAKGKVGVKTVFRLFIVLHCVYCLISVKFLEKEKDLFERS